MIIVFFFFFYNRPFDSPLSEGRESEGRLRPRQLCFSDTVESAEERVSVGEFLSARWNTCVIHGEDTIEMTVYS